MFVATKLFSSSQWWICFKKKETPCQVCDEKELKHRSMLSSLKNLIKCGWFLNGEFLFLIKKSETMSW